MSTNSTTSEGIARRHNNNPKKGRFARHASGAVKFNVTQYDVYTFTLRTAYLHHLLQPKQRRLQHAAPQQRPGLNRQTTSVTQLVHDFSQVKDTKSTRFPRDFMNELNKRLEGVLVGKERMPEYADRDVKRTFGIFLNEFKKPEFRKSADKDRKVEDLLLIFFSKTTGELGKGKTPGDDGWKLMVDRHVALFVRLISATLESKGWATEKPELARRLQTLEKKLLLHDQDLSAQHEGGQGVSTEVEVPRSQNVKDMPMVLTVAEIFDKDLSQVQGEIDEQKDLWTAKAALVDLKMYQANLSLNSPKTLRSQDFDTEEAYEAWKRAEAPDLVQMMNTILQTNKDLAGSAPSNMPMLKQVTSNGMTPVEEYHDPMRSPDDIASPLIFDQPVDMSALNLGNVEDRETEVLDDTPFMFIPQLPRDYYKVLLKNVIVHDQKEVNLKRAISDNADILPNGLYSKRSSDILNEIGLRWRLPSTSRHLLNLDVARDLFLDRAIELDTLEAAFRLVRESTPERKDSDLTSMADRNKWTLKDYVLNQQILSSLHDVLLRDLFEELLRCFELKPPDIGSMMMILENYIYDDPAFTGTPEELDKFSEHVHEALKGKAKEVYDEIYQREITEIGEGLEFYHVMQLVKSTLKLAERIQKRYRKSPSIMGVEPFPILVEIVLPECASNAGREIEKVLRKSETQSEEIPIQDGFDLYKEMCSLRDIYKQALPDAPFGFNIEKLLSSFVWRWIASAEANMNGWVEGAVKTDTFEVRSPESSNEPTDEERHSVSIVDIFRSFNQSVQQVLQLDWQDDLQYAKFMTALSKAIGVGLNRYCELVEQTFIKEMDRLTPEQEAALHQSRQEKWMKTVREAMTSKEKIEPFQFFPQSFVKLNNIEYAMLQLDKIEREIDVETCTKIIQNAEPPPPPPGSFRGRKTEKFVFTVKIIEAEDLRSTDPNGLSDPYVVLGDEYQKRLAKTRIVYGNLNPRWDETVDISTTGPVNITATVWDWDLLGDHDCSGRTTLKLDPNHFRDYLPREYWLDLDTQGRMLVRVSMEGEKDDIRFYFGKAFRGLKRTERDMTRKITDKLSAYINHCLSRRSLKILTKQGLTMQGLSMQSVSTSVTSWIQRQRAAPAATPAAQNQGLSATEIEETLKPLFNYFNENFAIMKETLTSTSMIVVMSRLWKEVLSIVEGLLVPPLSDKPSAQRSLSPQEFEIVFKWLDMLFDFFHAVDEESGKAEGVPIDVLKSPKYHELKNLNFFYFEQTELLIRTSEQISAASAQRTRELQARASRLSAPSSSSPGGFAAANLTGLPSTKRSKSIMVTRNLGTMRKAKEEKRKEAQAEPSDDMILRILRMRQEAARYLKDRSRQKERLAASAAAEMIVRQSLAAEAKRSKALPPVPPLPGARRP